MIFFILHRKQKGHLPHPACVGAVDLGWQGRTEWGLGRGLRRDAREPGTGASVSAPWVTWPETGRATGGGGGEGAVRVRVRVRVRPSQRRAGRAGSGGRGPMLGGAVLGCSRRPL